jgi:TPR repeat protein
VVSSNISTEVWNRIGKLATPQAATDCLDAANAGDRASMRNLGLMYRIGSGVKQDKAEALRWFRKAAEQGDGLAMYLLGDDLKDDSERLYWFRKAADAGIPAAMYALASAYEEGRGVEKDYAEAIRWLHKAADAGDTSSMGQLWYAYENGHWGNAKVEQDYVEAVRWMRKAAEAGDFSSMDSLGFRYEIGRGVAKDYSEAEKWYRKAASLGDDMAEVHLDQLYKKLGKPPVIVQPPATIVRTKKCRTNSSRTETICD